MATINSSNNVLIFHEPDYIIPYLPSCNLYMVYGWHNGEFYPLSVYFIHTVICYASDVSKLYQYPLTLDKLQLEISPRENIKILSLSGLGPYLKELILNFSYNMNLCNVDINSIPDTVEQLDIITNYLMDNKNPPIIIVNLQRLPAKLKKITLDTPSMKSIIFGDKSTINLESNGIQYTGVGQIECMEQLGHYCKDNGIELFFDIYKD